jgi:hypothetical protein
MEFGGLNSNEMVNIPPESLFVSVKTWLSHLSESYSQIAYDDLDAEVCGVMEDFRQKVTAAVVWMRKTQIAVNQYKLIHDRVCQLENKLDRENSVGPRKHTFSLWNQFQVLSGIRAAYSQYLTQCSVEMVDSCLTADTLYQDLMELEIDDADELVH